MSQCAKYIILHSLHQEANSNAVKLACGTQGELNRRVVTNLT